MSKINAEILEEHEDGSATMSLHLDDETIRLMLKQGFKVILEKDDIKDVQVCAPRNPISPATKTYELSDEEFQLLMHLGVLDILRKGLEGESYQC